jgi:hypothetical protein
MHDNPTGGQHIRQTPPAGAGQIAPLANIGVMEQALQRLGSRSASDPGMIVVSGPSGYGKSVAAAWAKARHRAYYLQLDDFVTKKSLLVALCKALGLETNGQAPRGTTAELAGLVGAQLNASRRALIIDEFDFAVEKGLVMSVFSIYEMSKASIVLIGEEALPGRLKRWEKFDGRVLDTYYAEAVGLDDARTLAAHKYPGFSFSEDLLAHLVDLAKGSVRRVNNNLGLIHDEGLSLGWEGASLAVWGNRPLQLPDVKRRVR